MAAPPLVERDIRDGKTLVLRLDKDRFPVASAFWYFDAEKEKWTFIIASRVVLSDGPREAYRRLIQSIKRIKKSGYELDSFRVELVKEENQLPSLLKRAVQTGPGISGIRLTQNTINGLFVEDAYIYRLT